MLQYFVMRMTTMVNGLITFPLIPPCSEVSFTQFIVFSFLCQCLLHWGKNLCVTVKSTKNLPRKSPVVRRTGPGRFLYRDSVPFSIVDGRHYCGLCKSSFKAASVEDARGNLLKHIRKIHLGKFFQSIEVLIATNFEL